MSKKDDGVTVVIAMMLILAIFVTCMSVYSTTYLPGLKETAEIQHSEQVKFAFERFASDVDNIYSQGTPARYSQPLTLGGGDVLLSPSKSSGILEIKNETIGYLTYGENNISINTTRITYTPSYSLWEPQGYTYTNGLVWITKGTKKTPASLTLYTNKSGVEEEKNWIKEQFESMNQTMKISGENMTMQIITMEAKEPFSVTGSGVVKLRLDTTTIEKPSIPSGEVTLINNRNPVPYIITAKNLTINILTIEVSMI